MSIRRVRSTLAGTAERFHHSAFGVEVRISPSTASDGTFEGYGSVHNVVDAYGTRMLPGSWAAGGLDTSPYALLWMHDPSVVLGTFTATEDERGLWIAGQYDQTDVGQRARAQAMSGSAPGLSVGFSVLGVSPDDEDSFTSVRLVEVSQITARMAATPGAELSSVRAARKVETDMADAVATALAASRKASVARARTSLSEPRVW